MENTFGNELREFNCLYKEVDEIYHEIALKMGISDSGFIIPVSYTHLSTRLKRHLWYNEHNEPGGKRLANV